MACNTLPLSHELTAAVVPTQDLYNIKQVSIPPKGSHKAPTFI